MLFVYNRSNSLYGSLLAVGGSTYGMVNANTLGIISFLGTTIPANWYVSWLIIAE